MRITTLIVLTLTLCILNTGCNSEPSVDSDSNSAFSTSELSDPAVGNSPSPTEMSAEDQYNRGLQYEKGEGVPHDHEEAIKWYRKAAGRGHASSQNWLGLMYLRGNAVAQDYKEAVKWFRLAAEQGYAEAQYLFGVMYCNV